MGHGAEASGATVQYCMSYARHLLQSVDIAAVSQFRASDDYGPGQSAECHFPYCVYDIGTTSILAWALGLAPSKDKCVPVARRPACPLAPYHAELLWIVRASRQLLDDAAAGRRVWQPH
jgi:hypothetical protein